MDLRVYGVFCYGFVVFFLVFWGLFLFCLQLTQLKYKTGPLNLGVFKLFFILFFSQMSLELAAYKTEI